MKRHARLLLAFTGCLMVLAGCNSRDPYRRDDVWYPTGSNTLNLAAQVANPADLERGVGSQRQNAVAQVKAVDRIWSDAPKALPASGSGSGGGGQNPSAPPGGS